MGIGVITLHKLTGKQVLINADLIESVEASPDTVITLVTGNRYMVKESPEAVTAAVIEFKRKIYQQTGYVAPDWQNFKKV